MSTDINLSAAIRTSLITLQGAQTLINRTQNDLSTGLKVNNAVDNPVAFFQAQALTDRASDFSNKKDGIDQAISSLSTSLQGVTSIENLVGQLQGLVLSAESASTSQVTGLIGQYNELRSQINGLAKDTSYQGLNLLNGTGETLNVSFSTLTASNLVVKSVDVTSDARGLAIARLATAGTTFAARNSAGPLKSQYNSGFQISYNSFVQGSAQSAAALSANEFFFSGTATAFKSGDVFAFHYGSVTLLATVGSAGSNLTTFTTTQQFADGQQLHFRSLATAAGANFGVVATANNGPLSAATINLNNAAFSQISLHNVLFAAPSSGLYTTTGHLISAGNLINDGKASAALGVSGAGFTTTAGGNYFASHFGFRVGAVSGNFGLKVFTGTKLKPLTGQFVVNPVLPATTTRLLDELQNTLGSLRARAETIGSNVALLNTRLDFTNQYVNLLTQGGGKLTLADLNEEGADLLSLQTRQQLGIQALSFAGQNEKAVLSLFR